MKKCKEVFDNLGHRSSSVSGWIACFITFSKLHVATLPLMPGGALSCNLCTAVANIHTAWTKAETRIVTRLRKKQSRGVSLGLRKSWSDDFYSALEKAQPRIFTRLLKSKAKYFLLASEKADPRIFTWLRKSRAEDFHSASKKQNQGFSEKANSEDFYSALTKAEPRIFTLPRQ